MSQHCAGCWAGGGGQEISTLPLDVVLLGNGQRPLYLLLASPICHHIISQGMIGRLCLNIPKKLLSIHSCTKNASYLCLQRLGEQVFKGFKKQEPPRGPWK